MARSVACSISCHRLLVGSFFPSIDRSRSVKRLLSTTSLSALLLLLRTLEGMELPTKGNKNLGGWENTTDEEWAFFGLGLYGKSYKSCPKVRAHINLSPLDVANRIEQCQILGGLAVSCHMRHSPHGSASALRHLVAACAGCVLTNVAPHVIDHIVSSPNSCGCRHVANPRMAFRQPCAQPGSVFRVRDPLSDSRSPWLLGLGSRWVRRLSAAL
jgi:hypothetical protein